ncbi:MAG: Rrf2 family transcriptional regulator [Clostridiales bacterium]|nr:Rrf2 family transcriptional regulator [Clostridiales bacterium]
MKLSTKGRYGLMAMLDLATNGSDGQVALKSIAERQELSENYLEQLFSSLKKANLVTSIRGAQGGYMLASDMHSITVGDILRALEGSLSPVDCVDDDSHSSCSRYEFCVTRTLWERIRDSINQVVDTTTLGFLVDEYKKSQKKDDGMFYI